MDLVHEQDLALVEGSEDRRQVALAVERRAGHGTQPDTELGTDHVREARLAEPRRSGQQDVLESFATTARGLERNSQLLAQPLLPNELVERAGAKRAVELLVALRLEHGRDESRRGHAACRRACRTRSSGGSPGSIDASTDSASTME